MSRIPTTRHAVEYGESLRWEPPAGTSEFFLWGKRLADGYAMRWRQIGGYSLETDSAIDVPPGPGAVSIAGPLLDMPWTDLLTTFDGFDTEILQVTAHGIDARLVSIDVYALPAPTSINAASIAAQERRVLRDLLEMRLGLSSLTAGNIKISDPSGTEVERMDIGALDRRIAEIRARIAWFEEAAEGNIMPRQEHW